MRKLTLLSIILISILTISITVNAEMTLEIVSGNNQTGLVGHPLKNYFKVKVEQDGNPLSGATVFFEVLSGGGSLSKTSGSLSETIDRSDAEGISNAHLILGSDVGENSVKATVKDGIDSIEVLFTVRGAIPITDIPDPTNLGSRPLIYRKYLGQSISDDVPDLVDHSYAGYKNGAQGIPENFAYPIYDVTDYGAIPNDDMSDYTAIKDTIRAAPSKSGAIIFFPPGKYDVLMNGDSSSGIWIKKDDVIVQGSGAQGHLHGGTTIKIHNELSQYNSLFMTNWEGGAPGSSTNVTGSFPRGTKFFDVENADNLLNPEFITIRADALFGDDWDDHCSRPPDEMGWNWAIKDNGIKIAEIHEIDYIEGNRIYIKAPTMTPLNSNYRIQPKKLKTGIGFQDLHINCNLQKKYEHLQEVETETERNGINLDYVAHSWIRRCRFSNAISSFRSRNSYCTSIIAVIIDGISGHYSEGNTDQSTYCFIGLLEDYTNTKSTHGTSVIKYAAGTVVWRVGGSSLRGPDAHGAQPRYSLFDNYRSSSHETSSGTTSSWPQHLDGYTYWNGTTTASSTFDLWDGYVMRATQANIIGYVTAGGDEPLDAYVESYGQAVYPFSLYEIQLGLRLDADSSWIAQAKEMYGEFFREIFIGVIYEPEPPIEANAVPVFTGSPYRVRSIYENMRSGIKFGNPIVAIDHDDDTLTYSLEGEDVASFSIIEASGQLKTEASFDYETKNEYSVIVRVSDGNGGEDTVPVTIYITNIHDFFISVVHRTPQVRDAIVAAVEGIDNASDITKSHLRSITYLNITSKGISELNKGDFSGLIGLKILDLNDNRLSSLPIDIFSQLSSLKHLFLSHNQLETLQQRSFVGLKSLKFLALNYNRLSSLPQIIFFGLDLWELNLDYNRLEKLQRATFSRLSHLNKLYLHYNSLTNLPPKLFSGLEDLDVLYLHRNMISSMPNGIFSGLTLGNLQLQNNAESPIVLNVSIESDDENGFRAVMPTGAPFDIDINISSNGVIQGGIHTITIYSGETKSDSIYIVNEDGEADVISVTIRGLSDLPDYHQGYILNAIQQNQITAGRSPSQQDGPHETMILPNYPNPFNPETWIPYQLSKSSPVSIAIYNIRGSIVRKLELGHQRAGYYTSKNRAAYWDGRNKLGESVSSGIYFYEFQADGESLLRKMVIIR